MNTLDAMRQALKALECGARASNSITEDDYNNAITNLRAAIENIDAPDEPCPQCAREGWKLVPIEPTLEMLDRTGYGGMSNYEIYKTMLAAAPEYKEQV